MAVPKSALSLAHARIQQITNLSELSQLSSLVMEYSPARPNGAPLALLPCTASSNRAAAVLGSDACKAIGGAGAGKASRESVVYLYL